MGVTLWVNEDSDETIELGGTLPFYRAFAELSKVAGGWRAFEDTYPDLSAIVTICEDGDDCHPGQLKDLCAQAAAYWQTHHAQLTDNAKDLLRKLTEYAPPAATANANPGQPRDWRGRFSSTTIEELENNPVTPFPTASKSLLRKLEKVVVPEQDARPRKVSLHELVSRPEQPEMDVDTVREYIRDPGFPIGVTKFGGKYLIDDGTHRAAAALYSGKRHIDAYVTDLDK